MWCVTVTAKEFFTPLSGLKNEEGGLWIFWLIYVIEEAIINHTKKKISSKNELYAKIFTKTQNSKGFWRITHLKISERMELDVLMGYRGE